MNLNNFEIDLEKLNPTINQILNLDKSIKHLIEFQSFSKSIFSKWNLTNNSTINFDKNVNQLNT